MLHSYSNEEADLPLELELELKSGDKNVYFPKEE